MDELRWYLYDLVREIMEKHGIEETVYSLETVREGAVCLILSDHGFLVSSGGDEDSEQEDFYLGMSTACEAVAANHMGMAVCGISCLTNMACGISKEPLSHTEVQETADRVAPLFKRLITASVTKLAGR